MANVLLLSGMDGTGVLFRPLLCRLKHDHRLIVYDFNEDCHQALDYQTDKITKCISEHFGHEPVVVVFESYSSLIVPYLLARPLNIQKIYIVGGFLACPSVWAKVAVLLNPTWIRWMPKKLLGFLLFRHFASDELNRLFDEVLTIIISPAVLPLFKQRLFNIAHATAPKSLPTSTVPCVYLLGSHDNLVDKKSGLAFKVIFNDIKFLTINGTHFLLQTNPQFLADELNQY